MNLKNIAVIANELLPNIERNYKSKRKKMISFTCGDSETNGKVLNRSKYRF